MASKYVAKVSERTIAIDSLLSKFLPGINSASLDFGKIWIVRSVFMSMTVVLALGRTTDPANGYLKKIEIGRKKDLCDVGLGMIQLIRKERWSWILGRRTGICRNYV